MDQVGPMAPATPMAGPDHGQADTTIQELARVRSFRSVAPSAAPIPISRVRCATLYRYAINAETYEDDATVANPPSSTDAGRRPPIA